MTTGSGAQGDGDLSRIWVVASSVTALPLPGRRLSTMLAPMISISRPATRAIGTIGGSPPRGSPTWL